MDKNNPKKLKNNQQTKAKKVQVVIVVRFILLRLSLTRELWLRFALLHVSHNYGGI